MADNTTLNAGSGGDVIATDDIGGVKHQLVKLEYGAADSATQVDATNRLPVEVEGAETENAAVSGGPVLAGGRYDATPRTLGTGDAGAIALAADGAVHIDDGGNTITVDGTVTADAGTGPWPVTDNGGSLTVDGTVTANLGATDNAVLDQIEVNTSYGDNTGNGTATGALRVTVASDTTGVLSVDDNGGSLTIDGTVTANAGTGTMTVDLGANNDVTIDGSTVVKSAQAAHGATDTGLAALGVRNDELADKAGADGDYAPIQVSATGAVYTTDSPVDTWKHAVIDAATSGDNTIVAAVVGKKFRVLSVFMVAAAAVTVRFEAGAAGTALTGQMQLAANGGFVLPYNPAGWFETGTANTLLNLELSAATSVDGSITYIEVS